MKFRISFWDEFSGDPAQDLGIVAGSENEAKAAAQRTHDEYTSGAELPREMLDWDGPMAETEYDPGYGTPHNLKARYWVHVSA